MYGVGMRPVDELHTRSIRLGQQVINDANLLIFSAPSVQRDNVAQVHPTSHPCGSTNGLLVRFAGVEAGFDAEDGVEDEPGTVGMREVVVRVHSWTSLCGTIDLAHGEVTITQPDPVPRDTETHRAWARDPPN